MKKLSIVVPVYFNEGSLPILFERLQTIEAQLRWKGVALELIFVDDGSRDGSLTELLRIKEQRPATRVVKLTRNFGAVQASQAGFRLVTGDCFLVLAADLQEPPELILELVDRWLAGSRFAVCVRQSRPDGLGGRAAAALYYCLLRLLVVGSYPQGGFDLALMDRAFLPHLRERAKSVNPNVLAFWLGFQPDIIAYNRCPRRHGRSRWNLRKKLAFFLDTFFGFSIAPLRLLSLAGVGVALASGLTLGYALCSTLSGRPGVSGLIAAGALFSGLLGLIIVMLGMLGEYLWRVFDEVNRRPSAVVDEVL